MRNKQYISILIILTYVGCKEVKSDYIYDIKHKATIEELSYNADNLVLYELINPDLNEEDNGLRKWRGIDAYSCTFDSIDGLRIEMSFGMMNGETFYLNYNHDSLKTNHRSWGCTSHESFRYETVKQELKLNTINFSDSDSIIGYINYIGIQDIQHKIKEWESYGENSNWLKGIKPKVAKIRGYFKLKIFEDEMEYSEQYDRSVLFRKEQLSKDIYKVKKDNLDSLNCSRMRISVLPKEIKNLKSISKLNLEGNNLKNVDFKELLSLPNLNKVYLGWNGFKYFPKNLNLNKNLTYINLMGNPIEKIPIDELLGSNVEYLNLQGSKLKKEELRVLETKMKVEL